MSKYSMIATFLSFKIILQAIGLIFHQSRIIFILGIPPTKYDILPSYLICLASLPLKFIVIISSLDDNPLLNDLQFLFLFFKRKNRVNRTCIRPKVIRLSFGQLGAIFLGGFFSIFGFIIFKP